MELKDTRQSLLVREAMRLEYGKSRSPEECSWDQGIRDYPQLSRSAPSGFVPLPETACRKEGDDFIVQHQSQMFEINPEEVKIEVSRP